MGIRISLLAAVSLAAFGAVPAVAAQYEQSGAWVFNSTAVAADGDTMLFTCTASTVSAEGTELSLTVTPDGAGGVEAGMTLENGAWALGAAPLRVRFVIGAERWVLPGTGAGPAVGIDWTGDAGFLAFAEALASSSFAGLNGRDGAQIAQFSLSGSRGAIEAMKACGAEQIGQGLEAAFAVESAGGANPF